MAMALVLLLGMLLPGCSELSKSKKSLPGQRAGGPGVVPAWRTPCLSLQGYGVKCSHHNECFSNCCLMDLDSSRNFCAHKARFNKVCLPQTKGAYNLICPCQVGLNCISRDPMCPRRCQII
ncbi:colipase-like protein 2 isoform X1 [Ochotona princeps]|uniref:colipase-like protein 2 isoform X1 n=1 Tax=Ochotona princeps TaxID=9978 RepID=UPI0027155479|nr:colipase-like protein 2 isoform X1 [Ochotona princeps]